MAPSQRKAIIIKELKNSPIEIISVPKVPDDYILVKVTAVALNPADYKSVDSEFSGARVAGAVVGCDYAGVVEEVGSKVSKGFQKGDRVAGPVHGSNQYFKEEGAFAEYIIARGDLAIKVPDSMSDEQAATLGIGLTTVGQGLYQELKLAMPTSPLHVPQPLLIYGASSATGMLGVQFAVMSGYRVITTSSPHNFEYLRSLGASETFDYNSPNSAEEINKATNGQLKLAWDCISSKASAEFCARALSAEGGDYGALLMVDDETLTSVNPKVRRHLTFYYTIFGREFQMAVPYFGKNVTVPPIPANLQDLEFGKMFWELARDLFEHGKIKPIKLAINRGGSGLEGVLRGLQDMREGKVSGAKLVYTLP